MCVCKNFDFLVKFVKLNISNIINYHKKYQLFVKYDIYTNTVHSIYARIRRSFLAL